MRTAEIISELANLPVEERALIADSLLQTLNPTQPDIQQAWIKVAQQRLNDISSGKVEPILASDVFTRVNARLSA